MATTKEAVAQKKKKSTSAPSSPPKVEQPHRRSRTGPDCHHGSDNSKKVTDQTMPRYLKPTISSCHDTNCHYPKHQQSSPTKASAADAAAGKRLASRKPTVDKAHSPTSACQKPSASAVSSKERAARSIASIASSSATGKTAAPSNTRRSLEKAGPKTPAVAKTLPMRKTKSLPKLTPKAKEAAKSNGPAASATSADKTVEPVEASPKAVVSEQHDADEHPPQPSSQSEETSKHDTNTAETDQTEVYDGKVPAGQRLQFKEPEERNVAETVAKAEQAKKSLTSINRKESTPAYNDVIEEAANKLATRRSKVRALAGAFETVISLQKPEGHSNQQQEDAAAEKSGTGGGGGKDERQEQHQLKNGGNGSQNGAGSNSTKLTGGEAGQQSQSAAEKSKEGPMEDKDGNDVATDTIKSTKEPSTESPK